MLMNTQLVEIQPRELKFICELKKHSSCEVHLTNVTDQYVAFKVKTTSPKKYCVRPNVGIIKPNSTCEITVTMQAQKSAPSQMQCKDKFLIQRSVVPFGTTEEDIAPGMFAKDGVKYIEESKLRVVLMTAPNSPVMLPVNGVLSEQTSYETLSPKEQDSSVLLPLSGIVKQEPSYGAILSEDKLQSGVENHLPTDMIIKKAETVKNVKTTEESRSVKVIDNMKSSPSKLEEFYLRKDEEASTSVKEIEESNSKLAKEVEELKSKFSVMDSKLVEAEHTIEKLNEDKTSTVREKEKLRQELVVMRRKGGLRNVRVGFPPLFVCMVALIGLMIGISFRA